MNKISFFHLLACSIFLFHLWDFNFVLQLEMIWTHLLYSNTSESDFNLILRIRSESEVIRTSHPIFGSDLSSDCIRIFLSIRIIRNQVRIDSNLIRMPTLNPIKTISVASTGLDCRSMVLSFVQ